MSKPATPAVKASPRWHAPALVGLSLLDDVAIAAFVSARWGAQRALVLGPKGIVVGCALGLVAGAAWCVADSARARRGRDRFTPGRGRR